HDRERCSLAEPRDPRDLHCWPARGPRNDGDGADEGAQAVTTEPPPPKQPGSATSLTQHRQPESEGKPAGAGGAAEYPALDDVGAALDRGTDRRGSLGIVVSVNR